MSADHRKPVVAFVVLAVVAAALIGVQRADAHNGRFFAAFVGGTGASHGTLLSADGPVLNAQGPKTALGPAFDALADHDANIASRTSGSNGDAREAKSGQKRHAREGAGSRSSSDGGISRGGSQRRHGTGGHHAGRGRWSEGAGKAASPHGKGGPARERGRSDLAKAHGAHRGSDTDVRRAAEEGLEGVRESVLEALREHRSGARGRRGSRLHEIADSLPRVPGTDVDLGLLGR